MASVDFLLEGAADLHCHFGPDAHRERKESAIRSFVGWRARTRVDC